jgi:hypothetical protein
MHRRVFIYLSLMLGLTVIFSPVYAVAAEKALVQNSSSNLSPGGPKHKASLKISFQNWAQPWNGNIIYTINSNVQLYTSTSQISNNDGGYWQKYIVDSIKLRMYNWSFDKTKSCSKCSDLQEKYTLKPGKDRPWRLNGTHIATHNGVACRINTFVTR